MSLEHVKRKEQIEMKEKEHYDLLQLFEKERASSLNDKEENEKSWRTKVEEMEKRHGDATSMVRSVKAELVRSVFLILDDYYFLITFDTN
jgi:hypothetical protein